MLKTSMVLIILFFMIFSFLPANGETLKEYVDKASELALQEKYGEAAKYYGKALELEPDNTKILLAKGVALTMAGNFKDGNICFDRIISLEPENYQSYHWKGISSTLQGQIELLYPEDNANGPGGEENSSPKLREALTYFDEALKIKQDYSDAWYWKGLVYDSMSRYQDAIVCYDKTLEIDPSYTKAKKAREEAQKNLSPQK